MISSSPTKPRISASKPSTSAEGNHLLKWLHQETKDRFFPYLEHVDMPLGKVLYEPDDVMKHVYFPTDCIISLLYVMEDGASAEISVIGNEGMVGISLLMGGGKYLQSSRSAECGQCLSLV